MEANRALNLDAPERRILALVLPDLACELALRALPPKDTDTSRRRAEPPLGVVLIDTPKKADPKTTGTSDEAQLEVSTNAVLHAVNDSARRFGVREGQTIAEACALVSHLVVREVRRTELDEALGRVAEVGLAFGATVSFASPDTVWVDITGSAHLMGGEVQLASELASRVRAMGHRVKVGISVGPLLARAFARWSLPKLGSEASVCIVPSSETAREFAELSILALPIQPEHSAWFARLGIVNIGQLAALPRTSVSARLGDNAVQLLELCQGVDSSPLAAYVPPRILVEHGEWEEPISGATPLLFVTRGLVARLSARLAGRGEAAQTLQLTIVCDRSIARVRNVKPEISLRFKLARPLWREEEIRRIVFSKLERVKLGAPFVAVRLEAPELTLAVARQLDFSQVVAGVTTSGTAEDELSVVIAELAADIGEERVGVLRLFDAHRPELKSALVPANIAERAHKPRARGARRKSGAAHPVNTAAPELMPRAPSRLLPEPVELQCALRAGVTVGIGRELYTIEHLEFEHRLEAVEWWTKSPVSRDYVRAWLRNSSSVIEAIIYVERETGRRYLQAIAD